MSSTQWCESGRSIGSEDVALVGELLGHSKWERAALLILTRQWSALPEELKLAILRVAGVDAQNL